jgi:hypothetical protein
MATKREQEWLYLHQTIDLKWKNGHFIYIKKYIQQNNNHQSLCTQHQAPKYMKQTFTDLKEEIYSHAVTAVNFSTPIFVMDMSFRQKNQ